MKRRLMRSNSSTRFGLLTLVLSFATVLSSAAVAVAQQQEANPPSVPIARATKLEQLSESDAQVFQFIEDRMLRELNEMDEGTPLEMMADYLSQKFSMRLDVRARIEFESEDVLVQSNHLSLDGLHSFWLDVVETDGEQATALRVTLNPENALAMTRTTILDVRALQTLFDSLPSIGEEEIPPAIANLIEQKTADLNFRSDFSGDSDESNDGAGGGQSQGQLQGPKQTGGGQVAQVQPMFHISTECEMPNDDEMLCVVTAIDQNGRIVIYFIRWCRPHGVDQNGRRAWRVCDSLPPIVLTP